MSLTELQTAQKGLTRKENFVFPRSSHVTKREIVTLSPEAAGVFKRKSNRNIRFKLPSQAFIDFNDAYFRFVVRLVTGEGDINTEIAKDSAATGTEKTRGVQVSSTSSFFSKFKSTINGQILEEISEFDLIEHLMNYYTTSQHHANCPTADTFLIESSEWTTEEQELYRHNLLYKMASNEGLEVILKPQSIGLFNMATNFPSPFTGEMNLEFTLNTEEKALNFVGAGTVLTDPKVKTFEIEISDMQFVYPAVTYDSQFISSFSKLLDSEPVPFYLTTWSGTSGAINGNLDMSLSQYRTDIKSCFLLARDSSAIDDMLKDTYLLKYPGNGNTFQYQFKAANTRTPLDVVNVTKNKMAHSLALTTNAISNFMDNNTSFNLDRFNWGSGAAQNWFLGLDLTSADVELSGFNSSSTYGSAMLLTLKNCAQYLKLPLAETTFNKFRINFPLVEIPNNGVTHIVLQKMYFTNENIAPVDTTRLNIYLEGLNISEQVEGTYNQRFGYIMADFTPQVDLSTGAAVGFDQTYLVGELCNTYLRQLADDLNMNHIVVTITNQNDEIVTFNEPIEMVFLITTDYHQELEDGSRKK
eukprot:Pgem_evm1s1736